MWDWWGGLVDGLGGWTEVELRSGGCSGSWGLAGLGWGPRAEVRWGWKGLVLSNRGGWHGDLVVGVSMRRARTLLGSVRLWSSDCSIEHQARPFSGMKDSE